MRRVYVISDLHGYYDLFIKLLEKISFSEFDLLYIIGDVCDRGPDSLKILFYIQEHDNIILIKGNHEYMMQEALYYGVYLMILIILQKPLNCGLLMAEIQRWRIFASIFKKIN